MAINHGKGLSVSVNFGSVLESVFIFNVVDLSKFSNFSVLCLPKNI